jgi:two-component system chemotaxis response regulator CheY
MRVLIVDDSPLERMYLSVCFEGIAEVDFAEHGYAAVTAVSRSLQEGGTPYDLICLDITMPVMNGLEALRLIRRLEEQHGSSRSTIFMITSHDSPEDMITAITVGGCDDYMVKPVIVDSLATLLRKHGLMAEADDERRP